MIDAGWKPGDLKLVRGGLDCSMSFGSLRIVTAPENSPPFYVEAMAFEEDTWLILSADPKFCEPEEHPIRLMTELIEAHPEPVGSVSVKGQNPIRFLAIIHDVDRDPTWREEWVERALKEIFRKADQKQLRSIGLPLLGTLHGRLEKQRFLVLLGRALTQTTFNHLKSLWLVTPAENCSDIINSLRSIVGEK